MIGPNAGEMAEAGEAGVGRMAEPMEIAAAAERLLRPPQPRPLAGKRVLITAGPTHEPIDPVRYIANRSSGKQGFAIAAAAQAAGAEVTLISGPVDLDDPAGVTVKHVESARDMLRRVEAALPVDIAIFAAAVADWRVANAGEQKLKKTAAGHAAAAARRKSGHPRDDLETEGAAAAKLVIGFAAETEHLIDNAKAKFARKGCDWIVANDVSPASGVMGGDRNTVHLLARDGGEITVDSWPVMTKEQVAAELVARIAKTLEKNRERRRQGRHPAIAARRRPGAAGLSERPCRGARSAGRGAEDAPMMLAPGKYALVPTGLTIALPPGYEAQVRPRSGLAAKHGVTVLNCAGHGGCGLSRRDLRAPDQPRRCAVPDPARRAHRADGDRVGDAGGTGSRGVALRDRARQRRFRFDRPLSDGRIRSP